MHSNNIVLWVISLVMVFLQPMIECYGQDSSIVNINSPGSININDSDINVKITYNEINEKLLQAIKEGNDSDVDFYKDIIYEWLGEIDNVDIDDTLLIDYINGVAGVYRTLYPSATIRLNDTISSLSKGKKYVFDIAAHTKVMGSDVILVYKLLPITNKAKFSDIVDFHMALRDIKVAKGIMICNGGFGDDVISYAKKHNIDLCVYKDARSINWSSHVEIPVIWIKSTPMFEMKLELNLNPGDVLVKSKLMTDSIFINDKSPKNFNLMGIVSQNWHNGNLPHVTDSTMTFTFDTLGLKLKVGDGQWRSVQRLEIYYTTKEEYYLKFFKPDAYRAIENIVTNDVSVIDLDIVVDFNEDLNTWVKIADEWEDDISINIPKGIKIIASSSLSDLSTANITQTGFSIGRK